MVVKKKIGGELDYSFVSWPEENAEGHRNTAYSHVGTFAFTWNEKVWFMNTLRPRQNDWAFSWRPFQKHFLKWECMIETSLKFVPVGPINNILAMGQIMAWHRPGNKPLSDEMMT